MIEGTRVKTILSKFERNLEQLNLEDRNSPLVNLPKPSFYTFQRSATCIDFKKTRSQSESEKNKINDTKNQSNFDRPTSENSKRGSIIRRSPAFRLNPREKPAISKPKDEKKQDPVDAQQKLPPDYAFLSDTLRKALKRPLPIGPPPKKPPRAFESPVKEFVPMPTLDSSEESINSSPDTSHIVNKSNQFVDLNLKSRDAISHHTSQTIAEKENHYYDTVSHADDEPIYSQPVFRRLSGSLNNSCCSNSDAGDLHYMCTDCTNLSQASSSESEDQLIGVQNNNVDFLNINEINSMKETTDKKNSSNSKQKMDKYEKVNFMLSVVYSDDTVKDCGGNSRGDEIDATSQSDRESQCSNSNYNCKLERQVTERRKDYVRSISSSFKNIKQNSKYESLIPKYCTLASEKPEPIANKIKLFTQIIEQNKKREESLTVNRRQMCTEKLFESCYLIGYNQNLKEPYVKSVYPSNCKPISYIEQFVYPYTKKAPELTKKDQNFCIILTDENGRHIYGYCRQVMPESFELFLPLTYCIVSTVRSTGFYYSVLKEIESRHGQTEQQMNYLLKCIHQNAIPKCGSQLEVKLKVRPVSTYIKETSTNETSNEQQRAKSPSIWIMENSEKKGKLDEIVVKRPLEYRLECSELLDLYESTSIELLTNIFGTLLIERKVILLSKSVAKLSSCIFALETILYPFRWQHTIITIVPDHLLELAEAPFPILVGILNTTDHFDCTNVSNGIVVDLDKKILLKHCSDEKTLLPRTLRKRLEFSLKLVDGMDPEKILSNVLIAEAFLKFFVELFFNMDTANYEKQKFIATKSDSPVKFFLDWFLETSMFHEFLKEKKIYDANKLKNGDVNSAKEDPCPSDGYFDLYSASIMYRCAYMDENGGDAKSKENFHAMKKNFKHLNKKHKSLLKRLKEFVNSD